MSGSVRIALVTDTYVPQVNGVSTVVHRIVRVLGDRGAAAAVVAPRYPNAPAAAPGELRVRSAPFPPYPAIRLSLPAPGQVGRFLRRFRPDLVHVVTEGPLGLAGRRFALRGRIPLMTSYHTDFPGYCRHYGAPLLEPTAWQWLRWFHGPARLTHTPGEFVRDALHARGLSRAIVWGRAVDTEQFHPERDRVRWRRRLRIRDGTVLVLHVGRLAPEKNLDVLIDAWSLAHATLGAQARFVIAGEGPLEARLEACLPWVTRLGFLDRDDLADLYAAADVCVLPSATETCGLVALEAMATGLAVIAADAGGFRESIHHDRTGLLAPATDARAFAAGLVTLALDRDRRLVLGAAARDFALTRAQTVEDDVLLAQYGLLIAPPAGGAHACAA
jgi:glycosyltransferase involved in cell wall biosynthesis